MSVLIARDGSIVGEYPGAALGPMARAGQVMVDDHCWQDGMEDWMPLPELIGAKAWAAPAPAPAPAPLPGRSLAKAGAPARAAAEVALARRPASAPIVAVAPTPPVSLASRPSPWRPLAIRSALAAAVIALALVAFQFTEPDQTAESFRPISTTPATPLLTAAEALALRDKAAADLRQRIERLPARAEPPLNTFYYDVRVNMRKTFSARVPWSASMVGFENVIDPQTEETLWRTAFTLQTDYENGEWVYKHYRASASNMVASTTMEIEEDENSPIPPSLAGMLGLKMRGN